MERVVQWFSCQANAAFCFNGSNKLAVTGGARSAAWLHSVRSLLCLL